jgi:hypothetical protein
MINGIHYIGRICTKGVTALKDCSVKGNRKGQTADFNIEWQTIFTQKRK